MMELVALELNAIPQNFLLKVLHPVPYALRVNTFKYNYLLGYSCVTTSSLPQLCSSGTYSPEGTISCLTCDAGYSCPDAASSSQTVCASGYYALSGAV